MPLSANIDFDDHRPAEQEAERNRDQRNDRQDGVAQRVLEHDRHRRQALGARGADVVGVEHVEHAGARQPHERRHHGEAERDGRQNEMREACPSR